jgi:hypothetical protein
MFNLQKVLVPFGSGNDFMVQLFFRLVGEQRFLVKMNLE